MKRAALLLAVTAVLTLSATTAAGSDAEASCQARPVVDEFVAALAAGDLERLEQLFAKSREGWNWYSVSDRAGQRLRVESKRRVSLGAYFAARIEQNEHLRVLRLAEHGNGNFSFLLSRSADDLHGGRAVRRVGKGWVSCETGTIGVWSLGGAPAPASFGPCPQETVAISAAVLPAARREVLRFVRDTYSEMSPALDVRGARVTSARLAPGIPAGYTARVKCGRAVQRRTAVIEVRFPRIAAREPMSTVAFYASRTTRGWLVWRLIP